MDKEDNILDFDVDGEIIAVIKRHRANTATMAREIVTLKAELQQAREANAWIQCDERMQDVGFRAIVYDALYQDIFTAYPNPDGSWTDLADGQCLHRVTHWRPLPEPPQA